MTLSPIDDRLAALWEQRQIEIVSRCDMIAVAVGRIVDRARGEMLAVIASGGADFNTYRRIERIYRGIIPDVVAYLNAVLPGLVRYSDKDARRRLIRTVPRAWWRANWPLLEAEPAGGSPLDRILGPKSFTLDDLIGKEPAYGQKLSSDEFRKLMDEALIPPLTESQVEAIVKSPNPHTGDSWEKRLTDLSSKVQSPEQVAGEIINGMAMGESVKPLRDRIDKHVGKLHGSSMRIARTEARRVAEKANVESMKQALGDLLDGWQITAVLDERTRPLHAARHGTIWRKGGEPPFEEAPELPDEPNCVLPGQSVSGRFVGGLKARYSGPAVEIETRNGSRVSLTVNHPVLTDEGFVAAGKIKKGHKLACHVGKHERLAEMEQHEQSPTSIENVFATFDVFGSLSVERVSALNLHGDAARTNGYVDVVRPDLMLLRYFKARASQHSGDGVLPRTCSDEPSLPSGSAGELSLNGIDLPSSGVVGASCLFATASVAHAGPFGSLCVGLGSDFNAELSGDGVACYAKPNRDRVEGFAAKVAGSHGIQIADNDGVSRANANTHSRQLAAERFVLDANLFGESIHRLPGSITCCDFVETADSFGDCGSCRIGAAANIDAKLTEPAGQSLGSDMALIGELSERFASDVAFDDVVHVRRFHYDGEVFDLETQTGWYFAGHGKASIGISNCRCTLIPVLKTPGEVLSNPAVAQTFKNDSGSRIPDPVAYEDWFRRADERRRRKAVGSRRYDVVKKQKPEGQQPEWSDFIGKDGKLIPVTVLKQGGESALARKVEVGVMLAQRRSDFLAITQAPFVPTSAPVLPRALPTAVQAAISITTQQQRQMRRLAQRIVAGEVTRPEEQLRLARAIAPSKTDAELRQLIDLAIAGFFGGR